MTPESGYIDRPGSAQSQLVNEAEWKAWLAKNRAEEARGAERHMAVVQWISVALLVAIGGLAPLVATYQRALSFAIALAALISFARALRAHSYVVAALFAALVVIFNPLYLAIDFTVAWQRFLAVSAVAPFLISLVWRKTPAALPVHMRHAG